MFLWRYGSVLLKHAMQNVGRPEHSLQLGLHGPQMGPFGTNPKVVQLCTHALLSRSPLLQPRHLGLPSAKTQLEQLVGQGSQVKFTELAMSVEELQSKIHCPLKKNLFKQDVHLSSFVQV